MTRKDYRLIAEQIRTVYDEATENNEKDALRFLVYKLCTALKSDNWRFDREKFISAALGS